MPLLQGTTRTQINITSHDLQKFEVFQMNSNTVDLFLYEKVFQWHTRTHYGLTLHQHCWIQDNQWFYTFIYSDIRDTVKYKEVMKHYQLGPNGGIVTSLNLFATRFDQVG